MRPCPNCGELAEDDAKFCHMCGERITTVIARVPAAYEPPPPERDRRWKLIAVVAAAVSLMVIAVVLLATMLDGNASSSPSDPAPTTPPTPAQVLGNPGTTRITVEVFNCAGCQLTALPADDSATQTAKVVNDRAEFTLATRATLGLAFEIVHPDGFGAADGPNLVVLAPDHVAQGLRVGAHDLIDADRVSVCWSGTNAEQATIALVVDPFSDGTIPGNLRAWADPAIAPLPGTATGTRLGTVELLSATNCVRAYANAVTDQAR